MKSPSPPMATVRRPVPLLANGAAGGGGRCLADAAAARAAIPMMGLVEIPELVRPGQAQRGTDQRPVLILDLVIEFGAQPGRTDRTRIPADGGVRLRLLDGLQFG